MEINIKFDLAGNPEPPTIILANRNGNKLGQLQVDEKSIDISDRFNDVSEFSFTLNKYINEKLNHLWNKVVNFKLVYCVEWDMWFEIKVELDEATETIKTVFCTQLGKAELSQIKLYNIEINTEKDIERDDYKISILYDEKDKKSSILDRILEKAPHYSIAYVDSTIAKMQRSFSFDDNTIDDAFQEIAEEIGCLFVYNSNSDKDGKIQRTISVYDLEQNCNDCGHRGEFTDKCPKCSSTNIKNGYGEDTLIFVTSDELASSGIQLVTDTDSVKNCFKLEAGDDLMTATIRNCNPNGSDYIWYFSDNIKEDMSDELVNKINSYDTTYKEYYNNYVSNIDTTLLNKYNDLINKYSVYNKELQTIPIPIKGYSSLMNAYYNVIDLSLYLKSGLMPSVEMSDTNASEQTKLLTPSSLSPVAVADVKVASLATVNSAVLAMAKIIVRPTFKVQVNASEYDKSSKIWNGNFVVTNYSDEEDTAVSSTISITINDDIESFVKQKIEKALNKENTEDLSITGLFEMEYDQFCSELKKYALNPLTSFHDACQSCIDILIEQGVGNDSTWSDNASGSDGNLYEKLYTPYYNKLKAIESEIKIREEEINCLLGVYDQDNKLVEEGLLINIEKHRNQIQDALNFEKYLGDELWLEFCSYRREDKYSNDNYISDGLDNAELFKKALEFIEVAKNEIYKSSELQHSISTTLNNLLAIPKFKNLVKSFKNGNWIRVQADDEVYKLRLLEYEISYKDFNEISVVFSDVIKIKNGITDVESVISQASSMATSYSSVQRQASQGEKSNDTLTSWTSNGLDATNVKIMGGADNQCQTWDNHGMLFREYDSVTDSYGDEQLKIINSTLAITNDNWKTTKTAIGKHYYFDPSDGKLKYGYGVNAEVLVGRLILGEQLGIYNQSGSMSFDDSGFVVAGNKTSHSFKVDPNSDILLAINNGEQDVLYIDGNGKLHITGDGSGLEISTNSDITGMKSQLTLNSEAITAEVENRKAEDESLSSRITQTSDAITTEVARAKGAESSLSSRITQTAESITTEVTNRQNADNALSSRITQTSDAITTEITNRQNADNALSSKIEQTAGEIRLEVSDLEPTKLKNSSLAINTDGIDMTGGNIKIRSSNTEYINMSKDGMNISSGASINMNSGSSIKISSGDTECISMSEEGIKISSDASINISSGDSGNIAVSKDGITISSGEEAFRVSKSNVSANVGNFKELYVGGKNILTNDSLKEKIVVSTTEPSGTGIIWIQPLANSSKTTYSGYTWEMRDWHVWLNNRTRSFTLTNDTGDSFSNGRFRYKLSFPIILVYNTPAERNVKINVTATSSSNASESVVFNEYTINSIYGWEQQTVEMIIESNVNLCSSNNGTINIDITSSGVVSDYLYIDKESYFVLEATNLDGTGGTQACNVFYKS